MCREECAASCPHRIRADQCSPLFLRLHSLTVDDGGGRTGFPLRFFATLLVKRMVVPRGRRAV
jgi:hypothetical protein